MQNDAISRSFVLGMAYCAIKPTQDNPSIVSVVNVEDIENLPALDVAPVVHAYWIGNEYDGYADGFPVFDTWCCSACGQEFFSEGEPPMYNFCPNCGARMDGDSG